MEINIRLNDEQAKMLFDVKQVTDYNKATAAEFAERILINRLETLSIMIQHGDKPSL